MSPRPILVLGDSRAVLSGFTPEPVALAALIASGVPIEWHEGVAIVQETARHALESPASQSSAELSGQSVRIDLTGAVFLPPEGVQDGAAAVSQLGGLLRDLLRDNMPVPLRLAISQAMSNPPYYASIKSFSDALAYFERPDRPGIIRTLYQRWESQARTQSARTPQDEPAREPEPASPAPARKKSRAASTGMPRWMMAAGGIGFVITLALVLVAVWVRGSTSFTIGSETASAAPLSDQSSQVSAAELPSPQSSRASAPTPTRVAPSAARSSASAAAATAPRIPSAQPESEQPLQEAAVAPARPEVSAPAASPSAASRQAAYQPAAIANPTPAITFPQAAPGSQIYSVLDTEVAAPVSEYPQTSSVATVMDNDEMLTFDLVIDQTGKVESVKLRHAPRSIRGTLMLTMSMSVAKAWRFQPATRHGQSVKYRQSISVPAPQ
jgi:hypothetical protein